MLSSHIYQSSIVLAAVTSVCAQGSPLRLLANYQAWDTDNFVPCPQDIAPTQGTVIEGQCTNIEGWSFTFNATGPANVGCTVQLFEAAGCEGSSDTVKLQSNEPQSSCIVPVYSFPPPAIGEIEGGAKSVIVDCTV
ncbi:unnamed protein product [Peniophora sp. CBMAI 1063]|nr:unnamed protein product [Peniophora sp. CBMAI 1063]